MRIYVTIDLLPSGVGIHPVKCHNGGYVTAFINIKQGDKDLMVCNTIVIAVI